MSTLRRISRIKADWDTFAPPEETAPAPARAPAGGPTGAQAKATAATIQELMRAGERTEGR
jgi:hypothetical protein